RYATLVATRRLVRSDRSLTAPRRGLSSRTFVMLGGSPSASFRPASKLSLDPRKRSSASEDIALGLEPAVVVIARREADSARVGKLIRSLGNLQLKLEQGL